MLFEITKQNSKGRIKTFTVEASLEYIKHRIDNSKEILSVCLKEGKNKSVIYTRLYKDKLLSQAGTWAHLDKYSTEK